MSTNGCKWAGWVPFLGYHHVLMILIAVAIILLCKWSLSQPYGTHGYSLNRLTCVNPNSTAPSRVFLVLPPHARHLPPIYILRALHGDTGHGPGRLQCQH